MAENHSTENNSRAVRAWLITAVLISPSWGDRVSSNLSDDLKKKSHHRPALPFRGDRLKDRRAIMSATGALNRLW